jgi:hypothetical protein
LESKEVIVLHGARQVGKTSIMMYLMDEMEKKQGNKDNIFYFDLELKKYLDLLNEGHEALYKYLEATGLDSEKRAFVFIDEIQYLENPSNLLKLFHDYYSEKIKLIVSGSSSFEIKKKFKNSLVGRTINFEIWPLDFEEFLLFKNAKYNLTVTEMPPAAIDELSALFKEFTIYGAYPQIVLEKNISKKEAYLNQIINTYIKKDIRDLANLKDIDGFNKLVEVLAAQTGNLFKVAELANTTGLARQTITEYLFLLENTYLIKIVKPYHGNLRSELFKTAKLYFIDHGIANLLANKSFPEIISGHIFETAVFSELLKNFGGENIRFWRTNTKQEIDFILKNGNKIMPIEVKLNINSFNQKILNYFINNYKITEGKVVYLNGEIKNDAKFTEISFNYPWDIYKKKFYS